MNKSKIKITKINSKDNKAITLQREVLDEVQSFAYLDVIVEREEEIAM